MKHVLVYTCQEAGAWRTRNAERRVSLSESQGEGHVEK